MDKKNLQLWAATYRENSSRCIADLWSQITLHKPCNRCLWLMMRRQRSRRTVVEDDECLKCHFYRKIGLMLFWAKITSIRKAGAETQKLVICSLIAVTNGSILSTLTARGIGTLECLLIFNVFVSFITLERLICVLKVVSRTTERPSDPSGFTREPLAEWGFEGEELNYCLGIAFPFWRQGVHTCISPWNGSKGSLRGSPSSQTIGIPGGRGWQEPG